MIYSVKTLSQLPLILRGFRKERGLTQAAMAARLNITQQSYAYFEANPATATLERLFTVLRMLDVGISLNQTSPGIHKKSKPSVKVASKHASKAQTISRNIAKKHGAAAISEAKPSAVANVRRIVARTGKNESW
ncbi:MAG: helix-turn-helix domain-containing protein [Gallionella sp.]